jgi:hypothetical protein
MHTALYFVEICQALNCDRFYMNKPFSVLDCMEECVLGHGLNHTTNQPVAPEIENDIIILNGFGHDFTLSHDAQLSK